MTFFHILNLFYTLFLLSVLLFHSTDSDLNLNDFGIIDQEPVGPDFWNWIFGEDANQTENHKPSDHMKEEMEYHYGMDFNFDDKSPDFDLQMDFYIFNVHDFDRNKLLDGLEMLSMMDRHDNSKHIHQSKHTFEYNTAIIDMILRTEDSNNDGFLDYNEFKSAKSRYKSSLLRNKI